MVPKGTRASSQASTTEACPGGCRGRPYGSVSIFVEQKGAAGIALPRQDVLGKKLGEFGTGAEEWALLYALWGNPA
jgi:hypothetical protein